MLDHSEFRGFPESTVTSFISDHFESISTLGVAFLTFLGIAYKQRQDGKKIARAEQSAKSAAESASVTAQRTATLNGGTVGSYSEEVWHWVQDLQKVAGEMQVTTASLREGQKITLTKLGGIEAKQGLMAGHIEAQGEELRSLNSRISGVENMVDM